MSKMIENSKKCDTSAMDVSSTQCSNVASDTNIIRGRVEYKGIVAQQIDLEEKALQGLGERRASFSKIQAYVGRELHRVALDKEEESKMSYTHTERNNVTKELERRRKNLIGIKSIAQRELNTIDREQREVQNSRKNNNSRMIRKMAVYNFIECSAAPKQKSIFSR